MSMKPLHRLKMVGGKHPYAMKLYLDGVEIVGVLSVSLSKEGVKTALLELKLYVQLEREPGETGELPGDCTIFCEDVYDLPL